MDIMTGMLNDMIVSTEVTETDGKLHRSYEDNKILLDSLIDDKVSLFLESEDKISIKLIEKLMSSGKSDEDIRLINLKVKYYIVSIIQKEILEHTSSLLSTINISDYSSHFIGNSKFNQYLKETNILISAHYWDPSSPKIFENEDLKVLQNLKIVGDITCDINGSVPTTIRSTTIEEPNYWIERYNLKEIDENNDGIAVMAVDNLPSELPRDSSTEFSEGIIKEVLPFLLKEDDGRILNGTITTDGSFLEKYNYLNDYIRINE